MNIWVVIFGDENKEIACDCVEVADYWVDALRDLGYIKIRIEVRNVVE